MITLERLSENDEICKEMADVGIIGMLLILLDFGISFSQQLIDDRYKELAKRALGSNEEEAQLKAIDTVLKILDKLCSHSERAREWMQKMTK